PAQRVLEEAVRDLPKNDIAKLALVDFLAVEHALSEGEQRLRAFIAQEPDDAPLRFGLGTLLERSGAVSDAIATYEEIIRRNGLRRDGLVARDHIAALEASRGKYAEAQRLIAEVLKESSRDRDALVVRANLALVRNAPAAAIADLRTVLQDEPRSVPVQRSLARAYLANGEPALAEELLRAALNSAPADPAVKLDLAQVLMQNR